MAVTNGNDNGKHGKKIKVLQFPVGNAYSGVTQYVLQNWKFIDREQFQFDFATLYKGKLHFEDEVVSQGCKVFHISCYAEENEEQFKKEVRSILSEGYGAVHLHTSFWKSFIVEKLAQEAGVPRIIVHSHNASTFGANNGEDNLTRHLKCVEKLDESIATDFWACSWKAAQWLYGDRIPKNKIVIQNNAIDLNRFKYSLSTSEKLKEEFGWKGNYVIGNVGRFAYQKNHEFLINVFRAVYGNNKNVRLLLIGVGPEKARIESLINQWGLQDVVCILERRNDVNELMQMMDCFVFPSRYEGLPIVLMEAQAAGCYCMISDAITEEVVLADGIKRLPLDEKVWIKRLTDLSRTTGMRYLENIEILQKKGYELRDQIKRIETGYESI